MIGKLRKILSLALSFGLIFQQIGFAQIATELNISGYLSRVGSNLAVEKFRPLHLRYFSYDSLNDNFKVLLDKGDLKDIKGKELQSSTQALLSYFLIGVTLPDSMFWVNLRPDSEDQIIDQYLEKTDVGRIMLAADLQLKKDTAAMTSPATSEGREYWDKLYKKAAELYGYDNVSIPTLTRPWIVPGEIIVRESQDSAYIYKATLKVMLEQDYLKDSSTYNFKDSRSKALNEYSSELIRELIIPKLTKEVNSSKRYAPLRQVYYSLILSRWFKQRFTGKAGTYASLINSRDLNNLISKESWSKTSYFKEYQKSFSQGEYNIQEPVYTPTGQTIRSYFSGGISWNNPVTFNADGVKNPLGSVNFYTRLPLLRSDVIEMQGNSIDGIKASVSSPLGEDWRDRIEADRIWSERRGRALRGGPDYDNEGFNNYLTPSEREARERTKASNFGIDYKDWKNGKRSAGSPIKTPDEKSAASPVTNPGGSASSEVQTNKDAIEKQVALIAGLQDKIEKLQTEWKEAFKKEDYWRNQWLGALDNLRYFELDEKVDTNERYKQEISRRDKGAEYKESLGKQCREIEQDIRDTQTELKQAEQELKRLRGQGSVTAASPVEGTDATRKFAKLRVPFNSGGVINNKLEDPSSPASASPISVEGFKRLLNDSLVKQGEGGIIIHLKPKVSINLNSAFIEEHKGEIVEGIKQLNKAIVNQGALGLIEGLSYTKMMRVRDFDLGMDSVFTLIAIGQYLGLWSIYPAFDPQVPTEFNYAGGNGVVYPFLKRVNLNRLPSASSAVSTDINVLAKQLAELAIRDDGKGPDVAAERVRVELTKLNYDPATVERIATEAIKLHREYIAASLAPMVVRQAKAAEAFKRLLSESSASPLSIGKIKDNLGTMKEHYPDLDKLAGIIYLEIARGVAVNNKTNFSLYTKYYSNGGLPFLRITVTKKDNGSLEASFDSNPGLPDNNEIKINLDTFTTASSAVESQSTDLVVMSEQEVRRLIGLLVSETDYSSVKKEATNTLERIKDKKNIGILKEELLNNSNYYLRISIAQILGAIGNEDAVDALMEAITTRSFEKGLSPFQRKQGDSYRSEETGRLVQRIIPGSAIDDRPASVLFWIISSLGETKSKKPIDLLTKISSGGSIYTYNLPPYYKSVGFTNDRSVMNAAKRAVDEINNAPTASSAVSTDINVLAKQLAELAIRDDGKGPDVAAERVRVELTKLNYDPATVERIATEAIKLHREYIAASLAPMVVRQAKAAEAFKRLLSESSASPLNNPGTASSAIKAQTSEEKIRELFKNSNTEVLDILQDLERLHWGFMLKFESKLPDFLNDSIYNDLLNSLGLNPQKPLSSQVVFQYSSSADLWTAIKKIELLHTFFQDKFKRIGDFVDSNKEYINGLGFAEQEIFIQTFMAVAEGVTKLNKIKKDLDGISAASPVSKEILDRLEKEILSIIIRIQNQPDLDRPDGDGLNQGKYWWMNYKSEFEWGDQKGTDLAKLFAKVHFVTIERLKDTDFISLPVIQQFEEYLETIRNKDFRNNLIASSSSLSPNEMSAKGPRGSVESRGQGKSAASPLQGRIKEMLKQMKGKELPDGLSSDKDIDYIALRLSTIFEKDEDISIAIKLIISVYSNNLLFGEIIARSRVISLFNSGLLREMIEDVHAAGPGKFGRKDPVTRGSASSVSAVSLPEEINEKEKELKEIIRQLSEVKRRRNIAFAGEQRAGSNLKEYEHWHDIRVRLEKLSIEPLKKRIEEISTEIGRLKKKLGENNETSVSGASSPVRRETPAVSLVNRGEIYAGQAHNTESGAYSNNLNSAYSIAQALERTDPEAAYKIYMSLVEIKHSEAILRAIWGAESLSGKYPALAIKIYQAIIRESPDNLNTKDLIAQANVNLQGLMKRLSSSPLEAVEEFAGKIAELTKYGDVSFQASKAALAIEFKPGLSEEERKNASRILEEARKLITGVSSLMRNEEKGIMHFQQGTPAEKIREALLQQADPGKISASSAVDETPKTPGGIDFRSLPMTIQPMGSFVGLNFKLPQLTQAELAKMNIDSEIQQIQNMVASGMLPSGQRVKELIAACAQKKEIGARADNLLLCLIDICKLEEENAYESSAELKEALVIVDSLGGRA